MDDQQLPNKSMNKKIAFIAAVILAVVLLVWSIYAVSRKSGSQVAVQPAAQQQNTNPAMNASTTPTSTPASSRPPFKTLSYSDAIKAYPERFQFVQCQGTPQSIAVKKGTPVMLDNRDPIAHTFKADTQTFRIAGYGYQVFYADVVGNLTVSCDSKPRVTLNVQK